MLVTESYGGGWRRRYRWRDPRWFERGYVTYSNAAKREGSASAAHLERRGAVSEPRARDGAARRGRGTSRWRSRDRRPGRRRAGKPVGTVCFAWRARIRGETRRFGRPRPVAGQW
jgi:nicotinamide-nucleotide amidase